MATTAQLKVDAILFARGHDASRLSRSVALLSGMPPIRLGIVELSSELE